MAMSLDEPSSHQENVLVTQTMTMNSEETRSSTTWIKPAGIIGGIAVIILILKKAGVFAYLSPENIDKLNAAIDGLGLWGPVVYILAYIAGCLFFLPGLVLTLVAGVFGSVWGTIYVSIGSTIGASLSFILARTALRPMVEGWAQKNSVFRKIDDGVEQHGWRMVMTTRLVPIFPFNLQNYAYGLTKVKFPTYLVCSWLFMLPGTAAYVIASGSIISGEGNVKKTISYLAIAAVLFVGLSLIPGLLKKKYAMDEGGDLKPET